MVSTSGILFDSKKFQPSGEITLTFARVAKNSFSVARVLGISLIITSIAGIIITLYPVIRSEMSYRVVQQTQVQASPSGFGSLLVRQEYARTLAKRFGVDNQFSIYIPKIGAKAKIIANVNSVNDKEMKEKLEKGVAHAAGTSLPGEEGGVYLFAHSTDSTFNIAAYNAVFYLLRDLVENDQIYVFFGGELYKYKVTQKHIVEGGDTSWLTKAKEGQQRLILQTCWPPGTTWKRLIVVADLTN